MCPHSVRDRVLHAETKVGNPIELLPQSLASARKMLRECVTAFVIGANILRRHEKLAREFTNPMALNDIRVLSDVDPSFSLSFEARD